MGWPPGFRVICVLLLDPMHMNGPEARSVSTFHGMLRGICRRRFAHRPARQRGGLRRRWLICSARRAEGNEDNILAVHVRRGCSGGLRDGVGAVVRFLQEPDPRPLTTDMSPPCVRAHDEQGPDACHKARARLSHRAECKGLLGTQPIAHTPHRPLRRPCQDPCPSHLQGTAGGQRGPDIHESQ